MESNLHVSPQDRGRKRVKNVEEWAKTKKKRQRYSSRVQPSLPTCGHATEAYQCSSLTVRDVNHFHKMFFNTNRKIVQDHLILKYCSVSRPKRNRQKKEGSSRKGMVIKYYIKKATLAIGRPSKVPVCQKTFMNIINVSKTRVQNICKKHWIKGEPLKENRGGDTRSRHSVAKCNAIETFMTSLKTLETHYCRGKSKRQYLASDLSINKLWRMYNSNHCESPELKAKKSFFRNYVNKKFNIGFGSPAVDVCSTCLQFSEKIKLTKDEHEKSSLMMQKRVHSLRAKAFFQLLGENAEDIVSFSFDCQKNQVLPKIPDQSTYYSRQIYMYNFCIVEGSSKDTLTKDMVFSYCWTENELAKGSNQIVSAVYHRLNSTIFQENVTKVRLFADGCGGQNKNSMMVAMASKWLLEHAPPTVKKVELIFPVTGHSFMPPDRVFAVIEKNIKKKDTIVQPNEYLDMFSKQATVIKLGSEECPAYDWKSGIDGVQAKPGNWHFKLNACKRVVFSRNAKKTAVLVRGECFYRSDSCKPRSLMMPGKTTNNIEPGVIPFGNALKASKLKDVTTLLGKHYGDEWANIPFLSFYTEVLGIQNVDEEENQEVREEENELCVECQGEDEVVREMRV